MGVDLPCFRFFSLSLHIQLFGALGVGGVLFFLEIFVGDSVDVGVERSDGSAAEVFLEADASGGDGLWTQMLG